MGIPTISRQLILTLPLLLFATCGALASNLQMKAGIGYDFFSQQYFLDSAVLSGPESLYTAWSLENNYLDDQKGMLSLSYRPFDDRRLELTSRYEQTADFVRLKFLSDYTGHLGTNRLSFNSQLDWRRRYHGTASFGDSYVFGYGRGRTAVPVSQSVNGTAQLQGEFVRFDSSSELSYDYYRVGGKLGVEKQFKNFSFGSANLVFVNRQVPDSTELNYLALGAEASVFAFYRGGEADLYVRGEHKNYNQPDNLDDHYRFEAIGQNKVRFGEDFYTEQEINFEMVKYNPTDLINLDYTLAELALLTGYETAGLSVAVGPDFEILREERLEYATVEDYFETGAKLELDWIKPGQFFVSLESVFGVRNLKETNDLQTDFSFARINLLGDLTLFKKLNLNALFSTELERHDIRTNDSRIYLLSSSLTYGF